MIAIVIGLLLFFTGLPLPGIVKSSVSLLAGLNTPLAMFTVGVYLARIDWQQVLRRVSLLKISAVKLLAVPVATLLVLSLLPESMSDLKIALLVAAACPTGSNLVVYAQLHDCDAQYASEAVIVTTLLSVLTLPLFVRA